MSKELSQDEKPKIENLDEKLLNPSNLKNSVKEMKEEQNNHKSIPENIQEIKSKFLTCEKYWEQSHTLRTKEIQFSFIPTTREE